MKPHADRSQPIPLPSGIDAAVRLLKQGGVVAVPTDTLYGLAASASDPAAVERVFRIKRRSADMALPLLLADLGDIVVCAVEVTAVAWGLAHHFWPGPLTLVVRRAPGIPDIVSGGMDTVAVRVPDHPVPRAVVRSLGAPITGTSANRSGGPAPTSAGAVLDQLGEEVDYVIDAGVCPVGVPSTVLDVTGAAPVLLRAGAVDRDRIEGVIGMGVIVG